MKNFLRKFVLQLLTRFAKKKLQRMDARIIGITGSVGKTSCKEITADILAKKYRVLKNKKSYNSEFGLLLTILHQESGFSSASSWFKILLKSFFRAYFVQDKYDFLVLEMGVDKVGDMDFLTNIAKPDIGIMTAIKPVHMANGQFEDINAIFHEKKKLFDAINKDGTALITLDDPYIKELAITNYKCHKLTYGFFNKAAVKAENFEQTEQGIAFDVNYQGNIYKFKTKLFGKYQISLLLPAILTGLLTKVPVPEIQQALEEFVLPPGRMSLLKGVKDILILDSSYNASPQAVQEAMKILGFFGDKRKKRKIFIFGNMNELGKYSKDLHKEIGLKIPKHSDILITVGEDVVYAAKTAIQNGMSRNNVHSFKNVNEAIKHYKKIMQNGDIVLVKGSQNKVRLEIFVKAIMANPKDAKEKLVRQDKNWQNIKP